MSNILVVIADSLRYDVAAELWWKDAESGQFFTNAWANGAATVPSFAALWAGLEPHANGAIRVGLEPTAKGLCCKLQDQGIEEHCYTENPYTAWFADDYDVGEGFAVISEEAPTFREPWGVYYHAMWTHWPYRGFPPGLVCNLHTHQVGLRELGWDGYVEGCRQFKGMLDALIEFLKPDVTILTSDHGDAFFEHGVYLHISDRMFPEQLHVPLYVMDGGRKRTERGLFSMTSLVDVVSAAAQGKRIRPKDAHVRAEDYQNRDWVNALRYGRYLAHHGPGVVGCTGHNTIAFDLESDPDAQQWLRLEDIEPEAAQYIRDNVIAPPVDKEAAREGWAVYTKRERAMIEDRLRALGYV